MNLIRTARERGIESNAATDLFETTAFLWRLLQWQWCGRGGRRFFRYRENNDKGEVRVN